MRRSALSVITATAAAVWRRTGGVVLTVAGLGLITAGAWMWLTPVGLAAAGVSCLILDASVRGEAK